MRDIATNGGRAHCGVRKPHVRAIAGNCGFENLIGGFPVVDGWPRGPRIPLRKWTAEIRSSCSNVADPRLSDLPGGAPIGRTLRQAVAPLCLVDTWKRRATSSALAVQSWRGSDDDLTAR
jgi:hypothetical protein